MTDRSDKTEQQWQQELSPEQYEVLRRKGTERAFTGKYWDHKEQGVYRCAGCGTELFVSDTKFDSHCGWPSFTAPAEPSRVAEEEDRSHGMARTEVLCAACGGHLGHVFPDGPGPRGLRYCINSAALEFEAPEKGLREQRSGRVIETRAWDPRRDWEAVCRIHDRARPDELAGCCDPRAFVPLAEDPEREQLRRSTVRVACAADGRVIAFGAVEGACIGWLYVDPAHRRQGLGRRLLLELVALAGPGAWTICLRDNAAARALYESEGFAAARTWEDDNGGYPCAVARLERQDGPSRG